MGWKGIAAAGITVLVMFGGGVFMSGAQASGCGGGEVVATIAISSRPIAGYSGDQLANAAAIMNAATGLGLDAQAQVIGVMTAMGESGLRVLDHGDQAGPDSRGLFQQRDTWGSLADRMDPTKSAVLFFQRLIQVPGWQAMTPTLAAHTVQVNADPNHYTKFYSAAAQVVQALGSNGGGTPGCAVGADQVGLAQELVKAADAGQLRGLVPDHIKEIRWIAQDKTVADCGIDTRVLQTIVLAVRTFQSVGVSDINRRCTGQIEGAGTESAHYKNGGGHAVDFYMLNGTPLTGADGYSLRLIGMLDPIVPKGSRVGQKDVRAAAGVTIATTNFGQIDDTGNHLHIDFLYATGAYVGSQQ
ncbi:hypothetical protein [Leifsonia poae]|uniref:hypothetical protein n=1 Tax=Leifsonia poae TaxID=110933 RepID=UPI001CBCE416|nr:hypothetical protein [Leifsonia poae]